MRFNANADGTGTSANTDRASRSAKVIVPSRRIETASTKGRYLDGELMSLKVIQLAQFGLTESGEPLLHMTRPGTGAS